MPPPLAAAEALALVEALERRLHGASHETLGISARSTIPEISEKFAELAALHHPRRYTMLPPALGDRASVAYAKLRAAYFDLVERARTHEPRARGPRPRWDG